MARKKGVDDSTTVDPCTTGQPVGKKHRTEDTNVAPHASALASDEERDTSPLAPTSHGAPPSNEVQGELQAAPDNNGIQNASHLFDGIAELASKVSGVRLMKDCLQAILEAITNADHIAKIARRLPASSEHAADKLQKAWTKVATYVLCAPYCKSTTLSKLAAALPQREPMFLKCAVEGTFNFVESLAAMDETIGNEEQDTSPLAPTSHGAPASNEVQDELQAAPDNNGIQNASHLFDGIAELASKVRDFDIDKNSLRKILATITNADHIAEIEQLLPASSEHAADKLRKAWTKVATYVLCAPYCKTTTLRNLAAALPKREPMSLECAVAGYFKFVKTLEAMDASIGNDPMLRLTSLVPEKVKGYFRKPWIVLYDEAMLIWRHVKVDCVATLFTMADLSKGSALPIVCGESGAGKTTGVLLALPDDCIGLYATPSDFDGTWRESRWADGDQQDERDAAALKVIQSLLNGRIPTDVADIVRCGAASRKPAAFYLAIDELGSYRHFLCAMSSINKRQIDHLGVPLKMIAIGTGTDSVARACPEDFHVFRVRAKGDVWNHIVKNGSSCDPQASRFLEEINKDNTAARELGGNSRVAALMMMAARELPPTSLEIANKSRRARDALCVSFFANVATEFRLRNATCGLGDCGAEKVFRRCARVVLFLQHKDALTSEAQATTLQDSVVALERMYGVLTDEATRIRIDDGVPACCKEYPFSRDSSGYLVAPFDDERGVFERYQMSTAQLALFRQHLGWAPSFRCNGDGFVEACLQFLEFALLGASEGTVLELLRLLNGHQHAVGVEALGDVVLQYSAVRVLQSNEKVEPGMTATGSVLEDVKKFVEGGAAVVLRNAMNTDFADVLVFLPDVGVILVQAGPYVTESQTVQTKKANTFYRTLRDTVWVSSASATPFVKRCLMTTHPRSAAAPKDALHFHVTPRTIAPVMFPSIDSDLS